MKAVEKLEMALDAWDDELRYHIGKHLHSDDDEDISAFGMTTEEALDTIAAAAKKHLKTLKAT